MKQKKENKTINLLAHIFNWLIIGISLLFLIWLIKILVVAIL